MRHGKKFNHLSRTAPHRKAMLSNMASSLIMEKRISTTVAKAKALRKFVEPLITRAKVDSTHSRRVVFSQLQNKESVSELFNNVADKIAGRPGGYTRILKTGNRLGDNADMCIIELVDYNEALLTEAKPAKAKTRRSRRGKGGTSTETEAAAPVAEEATVVEESTVETVEEVTEEAPVEEVAEEAPEAEAEVVEEPVAEEVAEETEPAAETTEAVEAEAEQTEEPAAEEAAPEASTDADEAAEEKDDEEPKKE